MTADKLSRLVAESAQKQAAPIPADMQHLQRTTLSDTIVRAYLINGGFVWWRDDDPTPVPAHAQALYVKAV